MQNPPELDEIFMRIAETVALRGTCPRRKVGAVITDHNHYVVAVGYNGAPRGTPHCTEAGCIIGPGGGCIRSVHAEVNAVMRAGPQAYRAMLYTTLQPCFACAGVIINAHIARVVFREAHDRGHHGEPSAVHFLRDAGVEVVHLAKENIYDTITDFR